MCQIAVWVKRGQNEELMVNKVSRNPSAVEDRGEAGRSPSPERTVCNNSALPGPSHGMRALGAEVVLVRCCAQIWKDRLVSLQLTAAELAWVVLVRDVATGGCVCSLPAGVAHVQE